MGNVDEFNSEKDDNVVVNLSGIQSRREFHKRIREAIEVPEYYGNNLDSLYDVLSEAPSGRIILVKGTAEVDEKMSSYISKFRKLCQDACEENEGLTVDFMD